MIEGSNTRRSFLKNIAAPAIAFPMINLGAFQVFAASPRTYSTKAVDIVASTQIFDMLSLVAPLGQIMSAGMNANPKRQDGFRITGEHLQTLLSSGIDVFHPAVGLGIDGAESFIARLNALVAEHPDHIRRIDAISDLDQLKKHERIGIIIGIQNSEHFREIDDVDAYYHLGQRISQLTYNSRNLIGTGSTDRSDGGLSDFGVSIVGRMNEVGMAVDVSHCGDRTTLDAVEISDKPILFTHSNVRKLAGGHVRCKSDEAIRAMAKSGGVMGVTGVRMFVSEKEPTGIEQLVDHIDYIARLAGIEHAGVGSDTDMNGADDVPEPAYTALKSPYKGSYNFRSKIDTDGFDHPKRTYDLVESLLARGYTAEHIGLILGANFKRALREIWLPERP